MSYAMLSRKGGLAEALKPQRLLNSSDASLRFTEANDSFEQEADRVAEKVMAEGNARRTWSISRMGINAPLQRKCSCGASGQGAHNCEECEKTGTLQRRAADAATPSIVPPVVHEVLNSPGQPLHQATRYFFECRLSHDFSKIRIHSDGKAAESAKAVGAIAYTVGRHVVFDSGRHQPHTSEGRKLLAHELAHTMQQGESASSNGSPTSNGANEALEREADDVAKVADSSTNSPAGQKTTRHRTGSATLQRYEAGEHAQFGETGEFLRKAVSDRELKYKVKPGETLKRIAAKFKVPEAELRAANSAKLKHWKSESDPKKSEEGFSAGDTITIPPVLNETTKGALKSNEITFSVKGVPLEYGEGIAMGDLFESPEQMMAASPAELQTLSRLIQKEKSQMAKGGKPIDPSEWQKATGGRFGELALKNEPHFAPSNPAIAPVSGKSTGNHKVEWEKHHEEALHKSQAGDKDKALATNAFADHFLTDAFAGGHLFNKRDVGEMFETKLPKAPGGKEFAAASKTFFDDIAKRAFVGDVQKEFSKWETVACFNFSKEEAPCSDRFTVHAEINSADRFSTLLQQIHLQEPDLLESAVVKGIHDPLNKQLLPVENAHHEKWELSGDGTLNSKSREFARKAVAQSQLNVLDIFKQKFKLDLPALFKKVWDFVPYPTSGAAATIKSAVAAGTDPKSTSLVNAVVGLIKDKFKEIAEALGKRKKLQKVKP